MASPDDIPDAVAEDLMAAAPTGRKDAAPGSGRRSALDPGHLGHSAVCRGSPGGRLCRRGRSRAPEGTGLETDNSLVTVFPHDEGGYCGGIRGEATGGDAPFVFLGDGR